MKTKFLITFIVSLLTFVSFGQNPFEGIINYEITFDGLPEQAKGLLENSKMKMYIKNGNSRTELNMVMVENITIYDAKTKTTNVLMNMMGQKYFIKQPLNELKDQPEGAKPTIVYSDETKKIAGYNCKKAIVKNNDENAATIWYTEEIPNAISSDKNMQGLQSIKGMPMEFEIKQPDYGFAMKMIVSTVVKESVDDAKFVVPSDYKETTQEQLMESLQKNTQQPK